MQVSPTAMTVIGGVALGAGGLGAAAYADRASNHTMQPPYRKVAGFVAIGSVASAFVLSKLNPMLGAFGVSVCGGIAAAAAGYSMLEGMHDH